MSTTIIDSEGTPHLAAPRQSLTHLNFKDQMISHVDFSGSDLSFSRFENCTFDNVSLARTLLEAVVFDHCHFNLSSFDGCQFPGSQFMWCTFIRTGMCGANAAEIFHDHGGHEAFDGAKFVKCDSTIDDEGKAIPALILDRSYLWFVDFHYCDLSGFTFDQADLTMATFDYSDLSGTSFVGARVVATDFSDAYLRGYDGMGAALDGSPTLGWDDFDADPIDGHIHVSFANFEDMIHNSFDDEYQTRWPYKFIPPRRHLIGRTEAVSEDDE